MAGKNSKFFLFIAFLFLGILLAVQFRSTLSANRQASAATLDAERIKERINEENALYDKLKNEIDINTKRKETLLASSREAISDSNFDREWNDIWLKAGLTDVIGPGITIVLDDAPAKKPGVEPKDLIIHDRDIRSLINELKKAGAQAISINGERLAAMSEQVCAGPTILINKNKHAVPYTINVIGNPDMLHNAISQYKWIQGMILDGIRVNYKKEKEIIIPKYSRIDNLGNMISGLEVAKK